MKKLNYFLTVVAGTMMLASCSHDKEVVAPNDNDAVQQIVLQVASNGDGLTTRAGRPLLSEEPGQKIDKVDFYIVTTGDNPVIKYTKTLPWVTLNTDYTQYGNGTMTTITFSAKDGNLLEQGDYTVYAIGYSNSSDYGTIPTYTVGSNASGLVNMALTHSGAVNKRAEEIFAGSLELNVPANQVFSKSIVLNRQVAGTYFYVHKLPMLEGLNTNCKIQLVASDANDQLVLGKFANKDIANNGDSDVMYVVNGKNSSGRTEAVETVICEAKISDWYNDIVDNDNNGIADVTYKENEEVTNYWIGTKEANTSDKVASRPGKGYVKGSIFASSFVIPFKRTGTQTLQLRIVDKDNNLIHSWKVNLPEAKLPNVIEDLDNNKDKAVRFNYSGSDFIIDNEAETKYNYSIVRNHLYSVGTKAKVNPKPNPNDPTEPDPSDPDPDPDPDPKPEDPQDISNVHEIVLKVNHNWEVIYRMELE